VTFINSVVRRTFINVVRGHLCCLDIFLWSEMLVNKLKVAPFNESSVKVILLSNVYPTIQTGVSSFSQSYSSGSQLFRQMLSCPSSYYTSRLLILCLKLETNSLLFAATELLDFTWGLDI
jgi:hypothetical protein